MDVLISKKSLTWDPVSNFICFHVLEKSMYASKNLVEDKNLEFRI